MVVQRAPVAAPAVIVRTAMPFDFIASASPQLQVDQRSPGGPCCDQTVISESRPHAGNAGASGSTSGSFQHGQDVASLLTEAGQPLTGTHYRQDKAARH